MKYEQKKNIWKNKYQENSKPKNNMKEKYQKNPELKWKYLKHTGVKLQVRTYYQSQIIELGPRLPVKKAVFPAKSL